jgi:hypothetical protein
VETSSSLHPSVLIVSGLCEGAGPTASQGSGQQQQQQQQQTLTSPTGVALL